MIIRRTALKWRCVSYGAYFWIEHIYKADCIIGRWHGKTYAILKNTAVVVVMHNAVPTGPVIKVTQQLSPIWELGAYTGRPALFVTSSLLENISDFNVHLMIVNMRE